MRNFRIPCVAVTAALALGVVAADSALADDDDDDSDSDSDSDQSDFAATFDAFNDSDFDNFFDLRLQIRLTLQLEGDTITGTASILVLTLDNSQLLAQISGFTLEGTRMAVIRE